MATGRQQPADLPSAEMHEAMAAFDERAADAIASIDGAELERQLIELAGIGGRRIEPTTEQSERYAANRPALSDADEEARQTFIRPLMEEADMEVTGHPFGLVGIRRGTNPDLAPLVVISHTDTVPEADMYDGNTGVLGAIMVAKALKDAGVELERDYVAGAFTGEESAEFGFPCFGSQSMFLGVSEDELASADAEGNTIASIIGEENIARVTTPIFGPLGDELPAPHAVIELHVSQDRRLEELGKDIATVDAIAAPVRHRVRFGAEEPLEPSEPSHPYSRYFQFTAQGRADHSGATPMTPGARHDGLLATSEFLTDILRSKGLKEKIAVGGINIDGQAINKIPGISQTSLRIDGDSPEEIEEVLRFLQTKTESYNEQEDTGDGGRNTYAIRETGRPDDQPFFAQAEVIGRQLTALTFIRTVNAMASDPKLIQENIVGTVGTFDIDESGVISLGLDIRGTNKESRDEVIEKLKATFELLQAFSSVDFGEPLAGSGDPTELDLDLVKKAEEAIAKHEIGSYARMFSAAGHDAQNAARAGIPTVMLFVPSRAGIAHNPEAYTSPEQLEKGVKSLAALVIELAA